jgi:glycosyltransferase involved in cell wall biosynthesis
MHAFATRLFPFCRSVTGDGVRQTLGEVAWRIPLEIHEVPSGTQVLDWTVPDERNIQDVCIATAGGRRVVDFGESTLHLVSYSENVRKEMTLVDLRPRLHVHSERPDWTPYRTSYYNRNWVDPISHVDADLVPERPMRIAVIVNMVAPYTKPLFERLARREECELLVVSETPMERDRRWSPEVDFPFEHELLDSLTLDLARLAVGSGFKTRFDTYVYLPRRPLRPLEQFAPDVVVAAGGGIWSSPANIAALAARRRRHWAVATWWGSFTRPHPTWPRRLADPWVKYFMRTVDACFAYGTRHVRDLAEMGVDPARTVIAPITALTPEHPPPRGPARHGDDTRFLFVGRFIERKGIETLLEAFRLAGLGELHLVGDGPLLETVACTAAGDSRIRLSGHLSDAALSQAYAEADVLIVPSLYEAWGLVLHEGLAHGVPVITTDQVGAADDLLDPGVNGYVVPAASSPALADSMRTVAAWTQEQHDRAGRRSRETLARCSFDRGADGFVRGCAIALAHREQRNRTGRGGRPRKAARGHDNARASRKGAASDLLGNEVEGSIHHRP